MNIAGAQFTEVTVDEAVKQLQETLDEMVENKDI